MDATLLWTMVGSVAGVAGVTVGLGAWAAQARSSRKHPPLGPDDRVRVVLEQPGWDDAGAGATVLRPPTGRLPEHVRGRNDLLARLRVLARAPDGRVHVLAGLGGTGKSTVALQVAEEASVAGRSVWWVPAGDAGTITTALLGLARELGATPIEVAEALAGRQNPADLLWRCLEAHPGWLLIFDNADNLDALAIGDLAAASGAAWIRPAVSGLLIVTSRISNPRAWGRHAELHMVSWLDAATGARILLDLSPAAGPEKDAAALSDRLGGLPLALHHAGSQLASDFALERSFAGYLRLLDKRFGPVMSHSSEGGRAVVTGTWEMSLDALAASGQPQARPLLRVLSCLAPAVIIPVVMLDLGTLGRICVDGEDGAADGLAALTSVGLITTVPGLAGARPGVTVHPLVTETSRLRLDDEDPLQIGAVAVGLLTVASAHLHADQASDWPAWLQMVPHLNAMYSYLADRLGDEDLAALARVTTEVAQAYTWAGAYAACQVLAESALGYLNRLGADHEDVLSLRLRLVSAYRSGDEYAKAEQECRDLLPALKRILGPDHLDTLDTRQQIAQLLAEQGHHQAAEQEYRDLLPDKLRVLGPDHPSTLDTRHQVAWLLAARGHHQAAEQEYRDLLPDKLRVLGPDHPSTLITRHEIARMLAEKGDREKAEQEFRDVLRVKLEVLGPDHPSTLITRYEIARMLAEKGDREKAEQEFRDVLAAQLRVLGPDHCYTLGSRYQVARMLAEKGHREKAEQEFRDVLAAQLRVLGPDHLDTLATRDALAILQKGA